MPELAHRSSLWWNGSMSTAVTEITVAGLARPRPRHRRTPRSLIGGGASPTWRVVGAGMYRDRRVGIVASQPNQSFVDR